MFVNSAARLQRPYGAREKSASAILAEVKRFVADMGVRRVLRDNVLKRAQVHRPAHPTIEWTCRERIDRYFKAGQATRPGLRPFPDVRREGTRGCADAAGTTLWLESLRWGSESFNRAATYVNDEWLSPYEIFYGSRPPLPLLPFF